MRASVCVGNYATTPYCISGLELKVYCMEELCYCIKENAFLLDASLMNDILLEWIERECGLKDLAKELYPLVHKQGSLSGFVTRIMEYVGFYSPEKIAEVAQVVKQGAGLGSIEKRKSQIDYSVKRGRYVSAIRGYDSLLAKWQDGQLQAQEVLPAPEVKAAILHNKGVAYTGLMLYRQAAEAFRAAAEIDEREEYRVAYLAAKRMSMPEEEYIAFVADTPENFQYSLTLEKKMEQWKTEWPKQTEYQQLKARKMWREGSEKQKYYEESEKVTQALKTGYRSSVLE